MARNYLNDAIRGYGIVNDMFRQETRDKQSEEDRAREIKRQEMLDRQTEEDRAMKKTLFGQQQEQLATTKKESTAKASGRAAMFDVIMRQYGPEIKNNPNVTSKVSHLLNPETAAKMSVLGDTIGASLNSKQMPSQKDIVDYLNTAWSPNLSARGARQGYSEFNVHSVNQAPVGGKLMISFAGTEKDGTKKIVPMTTGASRDDNDIALLDIDTMLKEYVQSHAAVKDVLKAAVEAGDMTFLDNFQDYRKKLIDVREKQIARAEKEKGKKEPSSKPYIETVLRDGKPTKVMFDPTGKELAVLGEVESSKKSESAKTEKRNLPAKVLEDMWSASYEAAEKAAEDLDDGALWSGTEEAKKAFKLAGGKKMWIMKEARKNFDAASLETPGNSNGNSNGSPNGKIDYRKYLGQQQEQPAMARAHNGK